MKRVNKSVARKLFNLGKDIFMIPCKANPHSPWTGFAVINNSEGDVFDKIVNAYEYYNCNSEMGYYPHYYVEM